MSEWQDISTAPQDGTVVWLKNAQMRDPLLGHWGKRFLGAWPAEELGWVSNFTPMEPLPVRAGVWICPTQWREASAEETS